MASILPPDAAQLAKEIYLLVDSGYTESAVLNRLKQNYAGILDLTENNIVHARTGGPGFIKTETAFGLMVYGGENVKGNAFIILRDTKILGDLLTDLNAMWSSTSANGYKVHDGFSQTFITLEK